MTEQKHSTLYSLTSTQREIWFHQLLHPSVPLYNIGGYRRVDGPVEPQLFEQAVNLLVQRHDALRTVLVPGTSELPMQTFLDNLPATVPVHDFSGENNPRQSALTWMQQQFVRPFDLYEKPLFQFALLKINENCFFCLEKYHHLIVDGWSISLITQALAEIYTHLSQGQPIEIALPSYLAFVNNDRAYIESSRYQTHRQYWLKKYQTLPEPLFTPRYLSQFIDQTPPSEYRVLSLARPFYNRLIALAKSCEATTFHLILGALYVYFTRTAQTDELAVGLPVLNRPSATFKNTVGLFVGVSAARFAFGTDLSFKTLLQNIGRSLKQNYRCQRLPISELNRELGLHQIGRKQLFDISVSYEKHDYDASFDSYPTQAKTLLHGYEQTPLMIYVREFHDDEDVDIDFVYNLAYFDATEIERIQSRFMLILEYVLNHVDESIRTIPLLTETEQQQLIAWNQTETDYPKDQTIVDLFQAQVEKTPENIAVVFEGQALSYQVLNTKANQLAYYLMTLEVGAETLVGICVERSLEMVIGLLGILKAGGAYVPLDPDYPPQRLQFMLEDSSVQVLLSQSHLLERLPVSTVKVVCLDSEWEQIAAGSGENPLRQSGPENLAYVLFTSGSTGKPKGVMIEHKSTTTLIKWAFETFRQEHLAGVLASTSINFDLSVYELFVPLCQGGQIFLVENALSLPTLAKEAITLINTVPSAIAELSRIQGIPNSVKVINLAGEPLNNHLVQTLYQQETIESIYNLYGPSEDTTYSTFSKIPKGSDKEVNIGSPIANSQIYILDWNHNPTPPGIPGELCIAGAGLARGYLNRPELTKEKFIEIEVFGKPQRLYKTGDKARWLPDGNLEYLGRLDHQVKLRGFRIELSEIEVTLSQHETVKEAVVVLYNVDSNPRLVAYVTLVIKTDEVSGVLRTWLKTRLPEYMLPASVTVLDKLPLTPNGKIDRKALPAPDLAIQASPSAPRTETEHLLCHLWSQVLGIEVTSIQSHFFEAGGHSLLATQLVSRIRESFWIEMPLRVIFEQPILCEQAEWLDKQQRREELPPIIPLASGEPLVLSFAQQRLWFLAQLEGQSTTYNMPAALQLSGQLNETVLQDALTALIQRHDSLRLCFPVVDFDATVQLNDIYNPLSVTDLSELSETEQQVQVSEWIANHAQTPFQLDTGPLLSLRLLKLGQQEQILLFNMHHIISDGWSMAVLVRDWTQLYNAYAQNQAPQLSELPIQYTDYAAWQRNWLQGEVLKQQLAYWTEKLSKAPELLELPTDYPRPAVMRYQGKHLQSTLEPEITQEIKQLSQQYGVTVFMTLLAAFNVLLSRYSGQNDLVVGSPIANRTHHQTEDLIGFFVNTLVLRTQIEGEQTFPQLLKQVRKTALEAYSHQDIPFEFLVEQLNPSRSLSHSPLFQVMFVLQNTPQESLELSGLKMAFLEPENTTAKFDLTLSIAEHGDVFICDWEYNTDLFRPETITLLSEHFHVLLEGILNHSEQSLSKLPILTEAEQQQLLAWNQTETDYPKDQTIVDLFQAQVEKTPENIAVVFEGQALSYQVLNTKANQLAYYLMTLEVGAETLVGICVERSLEMVIGLLGILKAGGAYVPLDPDYPQQRLQFMLEDSSVAVLFSQSHLLERLPVSTAKVVCLDSEWEQIAAGSGENPPRQSGPKNLAYVIYTSGSTGMPKGVMIEHIGLTNLIQVQIQAFDIIQESRLLQFASFSFDASVSEMATTLTSGATLQLGSTNKFLPDEQFIKLINRQSITHVTLPPSFLVALPQEKLSGLETMVVAGEVCSSELVTKWSSGRKFINAYGPTESTVCATMTECQADGNSPPIGKPIANTKITILDANHNPTPLGIPGELCIAGAGLARGYLNRPELTAEKFIEIEVFGKPQRLYKTGDKARWLPDGNLEYQGRLDHQVSLRGFRIELSEIEVSLSQHEAVKEAVVVLYNVDSNPRLVAYVTLAIKTDEVSYVLRTWLKTRLPEYMLPASFTVLDKLLLTPNGKINRKALPAPDSLATNKHYQAPRDTVELQLAPIWENVLEVRPIGINDNFFELGGHSLLAIRLMAQIEQQLERHLPLATLFQNATIEQLANQLRQQTDSQTWSSLVAIQPNGTKPPFFCVPGVGGNVLYFYELAHHLGPDQPVYGLQAVGLDGKSAPFTRIEDMAAHYLKELQTIQPQGPYLLGGHSFGGLVAFEISLQLQKQGHEVAFLGIFDMIAPPFTAVGVKWDDTQWLNKIAQFLERELGQKLEFNYEILQSLDADAQLDYLNKQLKKADCLPPNAPLTQLRGLVNVFKANSQIQYTPIEITKTPITLFKAKEARSDVFENEPTCGWHKFSESGVSVQIVPGDHFTMLKKPHVQILAAQLKEGLEQALVVN